MEARSATTPPSFDGIERRIAYANRKYHSGWMWIGAFIGFARFLFSLSVAIFGIIVTMTRVLMNKMVTVFKSLIEKRTLNFTLSMFV